MPYIDNTGLRSVERDECDSLEIEYFFTLFISNLGT